MSRFKVKITVLKRVDPSYIFNGDIPIRPDTGKKFGICRAFEDGQEFVVEKDGKMPQGFCTQAWIDIYKELNVLMFGGSFYPYREEGKDVVCCSDGYRPVSFQLERLND